MTSSTLLNVNKMFHALMTEAAPDGVTPIRDVQPDSNDEIPYVAWQVANNGQYGHGLWQVTLILNVVAEPQDVFDICSDLYSEVTGWNTPGEGVVEGVGGVVEVTDAAVFDRIFETFSFGKYLSQYAASFTISIQEM